MLLLLISLIETYLRYDEEPNITVIGSEIIRSFFSQFSFSFSPSFWMFCIMFESWLNWSYLCKRCVNTQISIKHFAALVGFWYWFFVCCVMSWSLGRGRGKHCTLCLSAVTASGFFFLVWEGGWGFRPCLCLLVGGGGYTLFSVCGGGGHFRPEPFAHLRKPRVFGPLSYSGRGVDRKPLACEDANNEVDRIPLACEDALYWSFSCDFIGNPLFCREEGVIHSEGPERNVC